MKKEIIELEVDGMDCNNCATSISRFLERKGLEDVFVNFQTKEVRFARNDEVLTLDNAKRGIEKLGYTVVENAAQAPPFWTLERKLLVSALFSLPLLLGHLVMMVGWHIPALHNPYVQLALALPPFVIGMAHFGKSAWASIGTGVPNMDVLIFLGSTAAFGYSLIGLVLQDPNYYFFETAATIITLVLLGNWFEHRAVAQTTSAIGELSKLQALTARRIMPSGTLIDIPTAELTKGMRIQVNAGDVVPADARILAGGGTVDESMLTGESLPVAKALTQELIGGSLLLSGSLEAEVIAVGKDTVLEQMVELVKTAQQDKPPIQQLADRISAIFVPVVVTLSVLTFLVGHYAFQVPVGQALLNAIAVLVISCPCAMGLATPTAVMVGVGRLARMGVLIKGGRTVEQLAGVRHIVFDKTGTLTTGKFHLQTAQYPTDEAARANALVWAMEQHSSHPIARSLRDAIAEMPRQTDVPVLDVQELPGQGLVATAADGRTYRLGSRRLLPEQSQEMEGDIFLLESDTVLAAFLMGDDLKPGMAQTVLQLKAQQLQPYILSGDNRSKTSHTAAALGITDYFGEKLPAEKLAIIRDIAVQGSTAMVGDGINDAPALAQADLGISLSSASQVAIQSAKVVLLNGRIDVLPDAITLSRMTVRTIRQNLFWAFAYNIVAIPIAAVGLLNPMWAALFMAFSDVVVIGNSLLLKIKKL